MSKRSPFRLALLPVAAVAMALAVTHGMCAEPGSEAARLDSFTHADGANYFALTLAAGQDVPAAAGHDVVVLVDTSASQTGDYRAQGMAALKSLLGDLPPEARVQLVAVDVNAVGMTASFVAPQSREMAEAVARLEGRVPLGATDMQKAITAAVARFADAGSNARSVVYIGDGMSTANLVGTEAFGDLTAALVDNRISVSSYAVGPRLDEQVLGALAANTGGRLLKASQVKSENVGSELAAAARGTVLWPESVTWPAEFTEVLPARMPPLRADRDSLVVGTFKGQGPFQVQMTVATAGGSKPLQWTIAPNPPQEANDYIARIVEVARADGGVSLPLVGSAGLAEAQRAIGAGLTGISRMAVEALSNNDLENAERLAREALRQDPGDPNAKVVLTAVQRRQADDGGPGAPNVADLDLAGPGAAPEAAPARPAPAEAPGGFMHAVQSQRRRIEQMITADVQNTINQARGKMSDAPEAAIQDLKLQLENVRRAPELEPDIRDQLVDQLQAAVRQAEQRQIELEERRQQQHEVLAAAKDRRLLTEELLRREEKMEQLMERFNYLMEEGRYRIAEETVALDAQMLDPSSPVPILATHNARMIGYYHDAMVLRVARQKGVIDTLYQAEKAAVPTPDEPPIIYPEAEVWQQLTNRRREKYSSMDLSVQGGAEQRISAALKDPTELQFIETPLSDVMETLKDFHDIEIQIDQRALDDVGIPADTPITKDLKGISLRSALRLMLRELDLTYVIEDEVLLITTPEEAEMRLSTKVYPVADLVIPVMSTGMMGGFGGMGGMGGGMGGMGGMGGGMGGMGGGMGGMGGMGGGMGGMGGGMGMFNVAPNAGRNVLPNAIPPGGFRAFSVKDDLSLTPEGEVKSTAPVVTKNAARPRPIEIDESVDPETFWNGYFAEKTESRPTVRQAVRDLMNKKKFDHVIALIQAALTHQQQQPWMYEAMALAMQAAGRPDEEVERAVMSAVDFIENPLDLMYIGVYLDRIGLDRRALDVYRQVSELAPVRPEPYVQGLKIAQRLNDLDGIKWATVGILSQAWTDDQEHVWLAGLGAARDTLNQLRAEKRVAEAKEFQAALDEAIVRDVVVHATWNGDADVDIMVEEPTGTVCSFRNPRTTAGGVMLGDTYSHLGHNSPDGFRETYVCPEAFNGRYRVLVRRVWGDVTAGKVAVTIHTGVWDKRHMVLDEMVALNGDQAVFQFDVEDGRRKGLLREHQVANAAAEHVAARHHVLAQQLAANSDPRTMMGFANSRQRPFVGGVVPIVGGGAVGYQPVIITLPEGTNMMGSAVVSADRRYVRVTALPLFSGVAEVNTFNTANGASGSGRGGTGGQGFSGMFGGGGGGGFGGGGGGFF